MLFKGLKLKVFEKGKTIGIIIVTEICGNRHFISEDENDPSKITEFKFLEETYSWHVVFEGLGGEKCVKKELHYTLNPI